MALWQWGLLLLAVVWALQAAGVWMQMQHYTSVFKGISDKYNDGYVGAGNFRGRLKKGTIALVVVSPDLVVRRLLLMSGRSVFTKFKRYEPAEGQMLDALRANPAVMGEAEISVAEAVRRAVAQIDKTIEDKTEIKHASTS
ncbi:MAG: transcriptional regulator GutM [Roseinatronobacter sp.]